MTWLESWQQANGVHAGTDVKAGTILLKISNCSYGGAKIVSPTHVEFSCNVTLVRCQTAVGRSPAVDGIAHSWYRNISEGQVPLHWVRPSRTMALLLGILPYLPASLAEEELILSLSLQLVSSPGRVTSSNDNDASRLFLYPDCVAMVPVFRPYQTR